MFFHSNLYVVRGFSTFGRFAAGLRLEDTVNRGEVLNVCGDNLPPTTMVRTDVQPGTWYSVIYAYT